jgi:hypothetical protein
MLAFRFAPGHCRGVKEPGLSEHERAVLDFERNWWRDEGSVSKADAIRDRFAISPSRYYAVLDVLADSPEACSYDPLVVHRLRRKKSARRRAHFIPETPRENRPR